MEDTSEMMQEAMRLQTEAAEELESARAEQQRGAQAISSELLKEAVEKEQAALELQAQALAQQHQVVEERHKAFEHQKQELEMTSDDLVETITHAIQQPGFAKIHVSAIMEAFSPDQQASFAIQDELQTFAESHGWTFQRESQDFMVFYSSKKEGGNEMINQNNIIIGDKVRMRYGNHAGEIATVTNITWHSTEHGGLYARFNISFEGGEVDERGLDSLEKGKESDNDSPLTAAAGH